jgi:hypothetical protein
MHQHQCKEMGGGGDVKTFFTVEKKNIINTKKA